MSDLIRKYDVVKICNEQIWNGADDYYPISANQIAKKVKELPTIDAVPVRHGKWIDEGRYDKFFPHHRWRCSECGEYVYEIDVPWFKYCPECGAKMDEERKEE